MSIDNFLYRIFPFLKKQGKKAQERRAARKKIGNNVSMSPVSVKNKKEWSDTSFPGVGKDITPFGILVETPAPAFMNDRVRLRFALHEAGKRLEIDARVRFVQMTSGSRRKVGLEFIDPKPEMVKYLSTILMLYK